MKINKEKFDLWLLKIIHYEYICPPGKDCPPDDDDCKKCIEAYLKGEKYDRAQD